MIAITVINERGDNREICFGRNSYRNLMELIVNELHEEIGDCRGRAWCGTCHVSIIEGQLADEQTDDEENTLGGLNNVTGSSRLACQIMLDEAIDGMVFQLLGAC